MSARQRRRLPPVVRVPLLLAGLYLLYCGLACSFQDDIVFPGPAQRPSAKIQEVPFGGERILLDIEGGHVEGWFLPGVGVSAESPGPAVLFAHGNAETIDDWAHLIDDYMKWGVSVLLMEFRGYGRSAGGATQEALIADGLRFYDELVSRAEVDRERIVLHGRSIGSGVACALSRERPARMLILHSPFFRFSELAWQFLIPPFVVDEVFDNPAAVAEFGGPIFLLHGVDDALFKFSHAERLRALNPRARLQPLECGHNDCPPQMIMTAIQGRLQQEGLISLSKEQLERRRFLKPRLEQR